METTTDEKTAPEKMTEKDAGEPIDVLSLLKNASPKIFEPVKDLYEFGPFLTKAKWTEIGDQVVQRERISAFNVPGNKYITLRLDGHGFSNVTKKLKRDGILGITCYSILLS